MNTAGRAVLITGASTGIGRECAQALAEAGYRVFAGVRSREAAVELEALAPAGGAVGSIAAILLDVTDGASIAAAAERAAKECGPAGLYGLVNNAGITVPGPLEILPIEDLRRQFEVNVFGQIAVTQAFLPLLRAARGRILFMGSIAGRLAIPFVGAYSGAKHALEAFADSLSMELRDWGIRVSIMAPGNIATPIWAKAKGSLVNSISRMPVQGKQLYAAWLRTIPEAVDGFTKGGLPPARVAAAVARALGARRPRARYTVGWDSRVFGKLAPLLPGRLRQRLVPRFISRM